MEISASSLMQEMQALRVEAGATPLTQPGRPVNSDFGQMLQQALDNIFNHPNVGPYLAKELIHSLVK